MLEAMPVEGEYRALSGKARARNRTKEGKPTRTKIDLFPEYIRHLPPRERAVWEVAGCVLRSKELGKAFAQRLAPGLKHRFGANFAKVGMYPIPILTRDVPGYFITAHPDTRWKGMTVQLYLPPDNSTPRVGTIFHAVWPDRSIPESAQMIFSPNSGYAFAVGDNTWHSVRPVGPEAKSRDSILLTYFVDAGPGLFLRNRGRRLQNFMLNELRSLARN